MRPQISVAQLPQAAVGGDFLILVHRKTRSASHDQNRVTAGQFGLDEHISAPEVVLPQCLRHMLRCDEGPGFVAGRGTTDPERITPVRGFFALHCDDVAAGRHLRPDVGRESSRLEVLGERRRRGCPRP